MNAIQALSQLSYGPNFVTDRGLRETLVTTRDGRKRKSLTAPGGESPERLSGLVLPGNNARHVRFIFAEFGHILDHVIIGVIVGGDIDIIRILQNPGLVFCGRSRRRSRWFRLGFGRRPCGPWLLNDLDNRLTFRTSRRTSH